MLLAVHQESHPMYLWTPQETQGRSTTQTTLNTLTHPKLTGFSQQGERNNTRPKRKKWFCGMSHHVLHGFPLMKQ